MGGVLVALTGAGAQARVLVGDAMAVSGEVSPAVALIDTGADRCAIDPAIAGRLQLRKHDLVKVTRVGEDGRRRIVTYPTHLVTLRFDPEGSGGFTLATEAIAIKPATPDIGILIGMDALLRMRFDWDGPRGLATFTY